jgi:hypothetical protein
MSRLTVVLICLLLGLTACSAPATAPATVADPPAPLTSAPAKIVVDSSCRTDADCTVKNVGNCCGHYPACVNVNSPTDPAGVQASCQARGMMSVCGFPAIAGCSCVQGQCTSSPAEADPLRRPLTENPEPQS